MSRIELGPVSAVAVKNERIQSRVKWLKRTMMEIYIFAWISFRLFRYADPHIILDWMRRKAIFWKFVYHCVKLCKSRYYPDIKILSLKFVEWRFASTFVAVSEELDLRCSRWLIALRVVTYYTVDLSISSE